VGGGPGVQGIAHSTFTNNAAVQIGGAVYSVSSSYVNIVGASYSGNTAQGPGTNDVYLGPAATSSPTPKVPTNAPTPLVTSSPTTLTPTPAPSTPVPSIPSPTPHPGGTPAPSAGGSVVPSSSNTSSSSNSGLKAAVGVLATLLGLVGVAGLLYWRKLRVEQARAQLNQPLLSEDDNLVL
jgi:hypothetical protein